MNYHFISFEAYPNGGAAANRHLALFKGLHALNKVVTLYSCMHHTDFKSPYFYVKSVKNNRKNKILKRIYALTYLLRLCLGGFKLQQNDVIVCLGTSSYYLFPLLLYSKFHKIKIYHERTELPFLMVGKGILAKLDYFIYRNLLFSHFDGVFLINNKLKNEVSNFPRVKINNLHTLNMMVDTSRFSNIPSSVKKELNSIVFCGDLSSSKDNVDVLLKAFSYSLIQHPRLVLKLIGNNNTEYYKNVVVPLIDRLEIKESVISTGLLPREQIPCSLATASLLVLSRENSVQAQYGFPTKLGEYLASGTPVLITETSEISLFLEHEENAFLAEPGNIKDFSDKINLVFSNYNYACEVGIRGKSVADKSFCSLVVAKKMVTTIEGSIE